MDSRSLQRKYATSFIGIYDNTTEKLIGYLLDLTTVGFNLKSLKSIKIETKFQIKMELPIQIQESKSIVFYAESRWCKKCENTRYYETGFEMMDVLPEELEKITILLKEPLFSDVAEKIHISLSMMSN